MLSRSSSRMGKSLFSLQSNRTADTHRFGEALGSVLRGGDVITLTGELGAGKTTFAQGMAAGLGWTGRVTSPTFTLVNEYSGRDNLRILHVDGYRLENRAEAQTLGLEELLGADGNVVVIEWPERIWMLLPPDIMEIMLDEGAHGEESRRLTCRCTGPQSTGRLAQWIAAMEAAV